MKVFVYLLHQKQAPFHSLASLKKLNLQACNNILIAIPAFQKSDEVTFYAENMFLNETKEKKTLLNKIITMFKIHSYALS